MAITREEKIATGVSCQRNFGCTLTVGWLFTLHEVLLLKAMLITDI